MDREIEITVEEFENLKNQNDYEVFDEKKKQWVMYKDSCYIGENEFPNPDHAKYPINVITIYDTLLEEYHTFYYGQEKYDSSDSYWSEIDHKVVFHHSKTEIMMLQNFMDWFSHNHPDIIATWNGMRFDIPYIFNRLYEVFCTSEEDKQNIHNKMSPIGKVFKRMKQIRVNGQTVEQYNFVIEGISHYDYLLLYRDKFPAAIKLSSYR